MAASRTEYRELFQERGRSLKEWSKRIEAGERGADLWDQLLDSLMPREAEALRLLVYRHAAPPGEVVAEVLRLLGRKQADLTSPLGRGTGWVLLDAYARELDRLTRRHALIGERTALLKSYLKPCEGSSSDSGLGAESSDR